MRKLMGVALFLALVSMPVLQQGQSGLLGVFLSPKYATDPPRDTEAAKTAPVVSTHLRAVCFR